MADTDWFAKNGFAVLWVAHWTTASQPAVPAGGWAGQGWSFWQHSSSGTVPGINGAVDSIASMVVPAGLVVRALTSRRRPALRHGLG